MPCGDDDDIIDDVEESANMMNRQTSDNKPVTLFTMGDSN
jgi:hypothetical protein